MANINHAGSLGLGELLKIYQTKGIYNNFSDNSELWKLMQTKRVAKPEGKEVRYLIRTSYGQDAAQFLAPGADGSFPGAARSEQTEASAFFKDYGATIDIPRHLLNKEGAELASYVASSLAEELDMKGIAVARSLSRMLCGDGSGALGKIASVNYSGNNIVVVLSTASADAGKSHVGNFQIGEKLLAYDPDGSTIVTLNAGTLAYVKVTDVDYDTDSVTVQAYTSADVLISSPATGGANAIAAGDILWPYFDGTATALPDVSGAVTDYGQLSYMYAGLESLAANDGRTVNGLTMSGAVKGSRKDAGGALIDRTHFQSVLSEAKRMVGKNRYNWSSALMFDTVYDSMLESWETDRQIVNISDNVRGTDSLGFKHQNSTVKFETDEFVSKQRIWMCPDGDVLQFRGTDIEQVEVDGKRFFMPNDSNGNHKRIVRSYMEGSGLLFASHPRAIACIENFSV